MLSNRFLPLNRGNPGLASPDFTRWKKFWYDLSNRLIQQGAKLITSASDILDDMGMLFAEAPTLSPPPAPDLDGNESVVYGAIGDGETHVDEIIARCGLPTPVASSTLLALEMKKLVRQRPGGRFVKLR